jgi:hypothetical protein
MNRKIVGIINLLLGLVMDGWVVYGLSVEGLTRTNIGLVVGLGVGGLCCLFAGVVFLRGGGKWLGHDPLLATGLPATAVIRAIRETGVSLQRGMFIIVEINLEVDLGTGSPYQVVAKSSVPRIALGNVGIGKTVALKVDPSNPNHVAIDWNAVTS